MRVLADGRVRRTGAEWQVILKRFRKSGLTVSAFCEREKLSPSAFATWKRKLSEMEPHEPRFVELTPPPSPRLAEPIPHASSGELELSLPGGVVLRWKA
jgi:hypothetical protein